MNLKLTAPPPTQMTASRFLDTIADFIARPGGWAQGSSSRLNCHYETIAFCATGAFTTVGGSWAEAAYGTDFAARAYGEAMRLFMAANDFDTVADIPNWNDERSRTQQDVVDAFRKAAALARTKEAPVRQPEPELELVEA